MTGCDRKPHLTELEHPPFECPPGAFTPLEGRAAGARGRRTGT